VNIVTFPKSYITDSANNHFTFNELNIYSVGWGEKHPAESLIESVRRFKNKISRTITEIINHFKIYLMKKLLYVLSFMMLVSCGQHKKEIAQMQAKQDSIVQVAVQENNTILKFIDQMNEIQSNLDSIKTIEKIISVEKASGDEMKIDAKQRIAEDISLINDLLQKNKALAKNAHE